MRPQLPVPPPHARSEPAGPGRDPWPPPRRAVKGPTRGRGRGARVCGRDLGLVLSQHGAEHTTTAATATGCLRGQRFAFLGVWPTLYGVKCPQACHGCPGQPPARWRFCRKPNGCVCCLILQWCPCPPVSVSGDEGRSPGRGGVALAPQPAQGCVCAPCIVLSGGSSAGLGPSQGK